MRTTRRTVVVLSDHALGRQALGALLRQHGHQVSEQALAAPLRGKRAEVVVLDLDRAAADTGALLRNLANALDGVRVVAIGSAHRLAATVDGAVDVELESARVDGTALLAAIAGRRPVASTELGRAHRLWAEVTDRQRDVLCWLAGGYDNPGIAGKLRVGVRAIKAHISALLALFGLDSRTQLALLAREAGLRPPNSR